MKMKSAPANGKKKTKGKGKRPTMKKNKEQSPDEAHWNLRLYIAGRTPRSNTALANLRKLCEEHLRDMYTIEVIDLMENPTLASGDQILAVPTLVRRLPEPMRKIIGDLSDSERVLVGLDIKPVPMVQD